MSKIFPILPVVFLLLSAACEKEDFILSQPDAKIIFISGSLESYSGWELMIMNRDGSGQTRITDLTTVYQKPVVSNSGQKVLFVHYSSDEYYELYSVNIDGTGLQYIDRAEKYCASPCWSTDDSKIVYSKYVDENPDDYEPPLYINPTNDIAIFDFATESIRILTDTLNNIYPKFTPDGNIAYTVTSDESMDIYVMETDGSGKHLFLQNASDPVWSANKKKFVFTGTGDEHSPQIFASNSDGSNPVQLTNASLTNYSGVGPPSYGNYNPHWTPDGKSIVYQSDIDSGLPEIWIMNSDGTNKLRLTDSFRKNENPEISSDGRYILFTSTRNLAYKSEIYLMDINGDNESPLSSRASDECFPVYVY